MEYLIRNLKFEDLEKLKEIYESSFNISCNLQKMKEHFEDVKNFSRVIVVDNKIIGHIKWDIIYNFFGDAKNYVYVSDFCIDKNYRKHGFGKALLQDIEHLAKEKNCSYIFFNSSKKEIYQFYKNNGYIIRDSAIFKKIL